MAEPRLLPNVPSSAQPLVLRSRYVHQMVLAVNRNTLNAAPPRNVENEDLQRQSIAAGIAAGNVNAVEGSDGFPDNDDLPVEVERWDEQSRTTSEVRVENPDDAEQFVDVLRIETVRFTRPDGSSAELVFNNPATE